MTSLRERLSQIRVEAHLEAYRKLEEKYASDIEKALSESLSFEQVEAEARKKQIEDPFHPHVIIVYSVDTPEEHYTVFSDTHKRLRMIEDALSKKYGVTIMRCCGETPDNTAFGVSTNQ